MIALHRNKRAPSALSVLLMLGQSITAAGLSSSLTDCLSQTGATLVYPDSTGYNTTAPEQNLNYNYNPAVIVEPSCADEVAATVRCVAAQNGTTKLSTYGGGHSYAAYALGGADGFVVIDSNKMTDLTIDSEQQTVTVGMGMTLGPLAQQIGDKGFGLPMGICVDVGVAGHSLGGGWGYASRKWGWLQDHLIAFTYVDPTGAIASLDSENNADDDIWWAMRGAGANNFGVITSFTFKMEIAPSKAVNWMTYYDTNEDCANGLVALQTIGQKTVEEGGLPAEFGGQYLLYGVGSTNEGSNKGGGCSFDGQFLGPMADYRATEKLWLDELQRHGVNGSRANATEFESWVDALTDLMGPLNGPGFKISYYAESFMDAGRPGFDTTSANNLMAAVEAAIGIEGTVNNIGFDLNGPVSATNRPEPTGPSAFEEAGKRKSLFFGQIYSAFFPGPNNVAGQARGYPKIDAMKDAILAANTSEAWSSYVNYVDPRLQDWPTQYYGGALERLKQIKQRVDPTNMFDFPQGLAHA